jgi:signal transduction histidine kinase
MVLRLQEVKMVVQRRSFSVTDSGVGVPSSQLEIIFERFRQVQAKDRRGLGLSLYIARRSVKAHGGKIWAELPGGGGTASLHASWSGSRAQCTDRASGRLTSASRVLSASGREV